MYNLGVGFINKNLKEACRQSRTPKEIEKQTRREYRENKRGRELNYDLIYLSRYTGTQGDPRDYILPAIL